MTNTQTQIVPIHKIVFFVVFISAAIMASLFIFHASQKRAAALPPEVGLVFTAPRDIKPFKLVSADQSAFTEKNLKQHWTLLFFGFTHCASVCPASLEMISRAYPALHDAYPNLQVVLASVDPERDTPQALTTYTQKFHSDFIGITGEAQELRKLQSQLGIYSARDEASSAADYQVQHTPSILLINPQGKWAGLYKFGLKPDEFVKGVKVGIG
jgi:protein SCO1/2